MLSYCHLTEIHIRQQGVRLPVVLYGFRDSVPTWMIGGNLRRIFGPEFRLFSFFSLRAGHVQVVHSIKMCTWIQCSIRELRTCVREWEHCWYTLWMVELQCWSGTTHLLWLPIQVSTTGCLLPCSASWLHTYKLQTTWLRHDAISTKALSSAYTDVPSWNPGPG